MNKWSLYDDLISGIPGHITCSSCNTGFYWTSVFSDEDSAGLALTNPVYNLPLSFKKQAAGTALRQLAELSKSWNFVEAAIGVAAISAYYNLSERAMKCGVEHPVTSGSVNAFDLYQNEAKGRKVAVVGRFPALEKRFGGICDLTVLERSPERAETPDTACEYILGEQDFVFLTGSTLVNKTMPRILELSKNAKVIFVGPSAILAPVLFDYGVSCISGFVVRDTRLCKRVLREANPFAIFTAGDMVDRVKA